MDEVLGWALVAGVLLVPSFWGLASMARAVARGAMGPRILLGLSAILGIAALTTWALDVADLRGEELPWWLPLPGGDPSREQGAPGTVLYWLSWLGGQFVISALWLLSRMAAGVSRRPRSRPRRSPRTSPAPP